MTVEISRQAPPSFIDRVKNRFPVHTSSIDSFAQTAAENQCYAVSATVHEDVIRRQKYSIASLPTIITYEFSTEYVAETSKGRKIVFHEYYPEVSEQTYAYQADELLAQSVLTARHRLLRLKGNLLHVPQSLRVCVEGKLQEFDMEELEEYAKLYNVVPFPLSQ